MAQGDHAFPWLKHIEDRPKKIRKASQREKFCSPFLREPAQRGVLEGEIFRDVRKDLLGERKNTEKPFFPLGPLEKPSDPAHQRSPVSHPTLHSPGSLWPAGFTHPLVLNLPVGGPAVTDAFQPRYPRSHPGLFLMAAGDSTASAAHSAAHQRQRTESEWTTTTRGLLPSSCVGEASSSSSMSLPCDGERQQALAVPWLSLGPFGRTSLAPGSMEQEDDPG